jgi:transformation/transcription domain-associated protein
VVLTFIEIFDYNLLIFEILKALMKLPCYKNIPSLVPLKKAALRALAASHYIPEYREKIFLVLGKALNSTNQELVEVSYDCMKKFTSVCQVNEPTKLSSHLKLLTPQ